MQIERKSPTKQSFVPLTLEITIENPRELYELWHRLNISLQDVRAAYLESLNTLSEDEEDDGTLPLWKQLDSYAHELGLDVYGESQ